MTQAFDTFDELAAMFLTAPGAKAPARGAAAVARQRGAMNGHDRAMRAPAHEPIVELLLVGHLPVRAGLWLTPYADAIGRQHGATALLRLDSDEPTMQLFRASSDISFPARPMLRDALLECAGDIDAWIVRAPSGANAATLASLDADRITILTSGDEAAIVAAYQVIKDLAAPATTSGDAPGARRIPAIGLAIVGLDPQNSMAVIDRLNRTTVSFLGVEVRLTMSLQRMDPGIKSTGFVTFADQACPTLAEVVSWLGEARSIAAGSPAPSPIAGKLHADRSDAQLSHAADLLIEDLDTAAEPDLITRLPSPQPITSSPDDEQPLPVEIIDAPGALPPWPASPRVDARVPEQADDFRPTPPRVAPAPRPVVAASKPARNGHPSFAASSIAGLPRTAPPATPSSVAPTPAGRVAVPGAPFKLAPKPVMINVEVKRTHASAAIEPSHSGQPIALSTYVEGLVPLPIRSPGHERIELALDTAGRLHLLGREQSLREMRLVESWARSHRELIALACPQQKIDPGATTVCHIFSPEPITLADLHGADLRLHVLAPVHLNGQTAWYAAPLNI